MDDLQSWPTGRLLGTAARLVEHAWNAHLAQHGLTMASLAVLHVLADGPRSQRELAGLCSVEDQTMSRILDRLERSGQVARTRDTADRRRILVRRTPAGERAFADAADMELAETLVLADLEAPELFRRELLTLVRRLHHTRWPAADPPAGSAT